MSKAGAAARDGGDDCELGQLVRASWTPAPVGSSAPPGPPPPPPAPRKPSLAYMHHVDGMRAVAVTAVVLHHLHVPGFGGGFVGVDVFLVISGFLITRLLLAELGATGTVSLPTFYVRRVRRLAPAMLVTLAFTLAACMCLFAPADAMVRTSVDGLAALLSASNVRFWAGVDYFAAASSSRPLLHTWSLSVEEQFYFVWPAVLWAAWRVGWRSTRALALLITGIGASSFALNFACGTGLPAWLPLASALPQAARADGKATLFYLLPFRVYEFAIGGLLAALTGAAAAAGPGPAGAPPPALAQALPKQAAGRPGTVAPVHVEAFGVESRSPHPGQAGSALSRAGWDAAFLAGGACIAAAIARFNSAMLFPALPGLVPCTGAALLILSGGRSRLQPLLTHRPTVWVGTISYSLYLVHWPIIACTTYVVGTVPPSWYAKLALGAASLAGAVALHTLVENPCRRARPGVLPRVAGAAVCVAIACAALAARAGRPWPLAQPTYPAQVVLPSGPVTLPVASADAFKRELYGGAGYKVRAVYGHTPADIVLIGDSHGRAYAHGLATEVGPSTPTNASQHVLVGTSMLWLPNFVRQDPPGYDWEAALSASLDRLADVMRAAPHPKPVVVVGQAWLYQVRMGHLIDSAGQKVDRRAGVADIVDGLVQLKDRASIDRLVVFGQVPPVPISDLYDRLTRPTRVGRHIGFNVHGFECNAAAIQFNKEMRAAANRTGAFTFLDPGPPLRTRGQCAAVDKDGTLLFIDGMHLSKAGSQAVVKHYAGQLRAVLRGRE